MTVTGFSHVNVNCADRDASLPFYADVIGLPVAKVFPERQDTGALVGLKPPHSNRVAVLSPGRAEASIELIEWRLPDTPCDPAVAEGERLAGIAELVVTVPDPAAVRRRAEQAGHLVLPAEDPSQLLVRSPEGGWVRVRAGDRVLLAGAVVDVVDLDASVRSYAEGLGLTAGPVTEVRDGAGAPYRSVDLDVPAAGAAFTITVRMFDDRRTGAAPQRRADTVGFRRLAFFDKEVEASYRRAMDLGGRPVSPPEFFEFGSLTAHAALWFDTDDVLVEVLTFVKRGEA
ncbi:VOC family protein [Streptomyces sp. NPDC007264]|uniref:VOC family protein n=1 Tax=Streptomyces sp. NPDC007264 TaxID=3364777 RepID=UPI0036DB59FD